MDGMLMRLAMLIPIFIGSITLHEFGHALVANSLGDSTAKDAGRLTLNPLVHLDVFGTLMIFIAGFGWAKPVPVMTSRLRWPRLGSFLVSAAGPAMNFLLAIATLLVLKQFPDLPPGSQRWLGLAFDLNVMLMVFNLIPIPPLDGGHLLEALVPRRWLPSFEHLMPYGVVLLLVLVFMPGPFRPLGMLFDSARTAMIRLI